MYSLWPCPLQVLNCPQEPGCPHISSCSAWWAWLFYVIIPGLGCLSNLAYIRRGLWRGAGFCQPGTLSCVIGLSTEWNAVAGLHPDQRCRESTVLSLVYRHLCSGAGSAVGGSKPWRGRINLQFLVVLSSCFRWD